MKPLKLLSMSILIASALLLSAAKSGSAPSQKLHRKQHDAKAEPQANAVKNQEPQIPRSIWEHTDARLAEAIAALKQQSIATQEYAEANKQTFYSPSVVVNEVLALIGALYLVAMFLQWREIARQADIAAKTLILARRPWLRIVQVRLVGDLTVDRPIEVSLSVVNTGGTTANIEQSNFTVLIDSRYTTPYKRIQSARQLPEMYDGDLHFFENALNYSTIGGGYQTIPVSKTTSLMYSHRDHFDIFNACSQTIYALGYIWYRDELYQPHKTWFCHRFDRTSQRFSPVDDPELEAAY